MYNSLPGLDTHKHCWNPARGLPQSDICTLPPPFGAKNSLDQENQSGVLIAAELEVQFQLLLVLDWAECWKVLESMDTLTNPLFPQVIPLHLPPAFSSVEIFHLHHMAKIKSRPWKVRKPLQTARHVHWIKIMMANKWREQKINPSFLTALQQRGGLIHPRCVYSWPGVVSCFSQVLWRLWQILYVNIPASIKGTEQGEKSQYFVKPLITWRSWEWPCFPCLVRQLWSDKKLVL